MKVFSVASYMYILVESVGFSADPEKVNTVGYHHGLGYHDGYHGYHDGYMVKQGRTIYVYKYI